MRAAAEYNGCGCLLWSEDTPGACARAKTQEEAEGKLPAEVARLRAWLSLPLDNGPVNVVFRQETSLRVEDADSDILLPSERLPLGPAEYEFLRDAALFSAKCFLELYSAFPDKDALLRPRRETFYGPLPATAREMYTHTANVNAYYFSEIGVAASNTPDIYSSRVRGFELLERIPGFLENTVREGSYGELWSLRKMLRRFIWHDCIHARAMYRRAPEGVSLPDPFLFSVLPVFS